ncbi:acyl-ACP--UDP-N-acetylglucosamine O-acyltransferase [Candidatus Pelagibacter sp.]|nr:acyl-ACP--UDP-N-acetylglucosamine O-acyltransferase [Candidatus Pelagibacter sp.]
MIHKTAIVDVKAKISDNVKIGPYCFIGPEVEIGANSVLHSHVNIVGNTKIGKNNQIYPFSSIGTPPQDLKYKGEKNSLIIGNNNKFREYVNINPGTEQGGGVTTVGDNNLFMVYCHVAHDCSISNNIVLANNVQVGGHVSIQNNAIVGGSCAIHQFSRIGESAMVGGMTGVLSDVIPFGLSMGNRNNLMGLNLIGLRRSKVSNENIKKIQLAYEIIFKTPNFRENIEGIDSDLKNNEFVKKILNFLNSDKKRPISLPPSK